MDRNYTTAIKGFSILTVGWAHSGAALSVGGIQFIAGIGVALFLICSGYGLEISYEKNGLNGFWKKRFLNVCIPFWGVELVGLVVTGEFSVKKYLMDITFIRPATGYGWFMGYIVICYLIFYVVKYFVSNKKWRTRTLFGIFVAWFVIDSIFLANPNMPFLRARQMMSFPFGVVLALKKDEIERMLNRMRSTLILAGGGIACILFMAVTQLQAVKNMPYLISNTMAIMTCLPVAIGILVIGKSFSKLYENRALYIIGIISYEIYLVHAFTLNLIEMNMISILLFIVITYVLAYALHIGIRKVKK